MRRLAGPLSVASVALIGVFPARAAVLLTVRNPVAEEGIFGYAVAAESGRIVVGAPHTTVDGRAQGGAVYVFDATSGALLRTLLDPARRDDDIFGHSVAAAAGRVLVGAPRTDVYGMSMAGAAYLFDAATGRLLRNFTAPSPTAGAEFGEAVAFVDGEALIAAPAAVVDGASAAGAVFRFDARGRVRRTYTARPAPVRDEIFGVGLVSLGTELLVGAAHATVDGRARAGAVYLLDAESAALRRSWRNPTPEVDANFGSSIAGTATTIAIGAPNAADGDAARAGAVYVYDRASGALVRTLREPVLGRRDRLFGYALAGACGRLLVSALHADPDHKWLAGLVYEFDVASGALVRTLREPVPRERSGFGIAMTTLDERPVIGAERAGDDVMRGAVYLFDCGGERR
jgi:outer membrane protein assembly factor BamB